METEMMIMSTTTMMKNLGMLVLVISPAMTMMMSEAEQLAVYENPVVGDGGRFPRKKNWNAKNQPFLG